VCRALLALLIVALAGSAAAAERIVLTLGTATPGGGFPVYGDAIVATVNEQDPDLALEPRNTKGSTENVPLLENSDDFVFDNEMLTQCIYFGYRIGEVSCPTRYFAEASSINFKRSVKYGFGVLGTSVKFRLQKSGIAKFRLFSGAGRKLLSDYYAAVEVPPKR